MKFLSDVFQSLHSPLFYQQVFKDAEGGTGLAYLFKLLTLCWFVVAILLTYLVLEARKNPDESPLLFPTQVLHKISPQFPLVTIAKGKAKVAGAQPMTLLDPVTGLPLMIIDTTGKVNSLDANSKATILLTRSAIKMRYEGEDILYEIPEQVDMTIDSGKLEEWAGFMERMMPYAPFIMLPFNILGNMLGIALRWLLMGIIAFISLKPKLENTKFDDCLRIAAYALTASVLLKMVIVGSGFQPFGSPEMVVLGVGMLYLFFGVSAALRVKK